jgi:hypothetical protein
MLTSEEAGVPQSKASIERERKRRKAAHDKFERHLKDVETSLEHSAVVIRDSKREISRSHRIINQINKRHGEREREK